MRKAYKKKADQKYYLANRERLIERARQWRLANLQKFRASANKSSKRPCYKRSHADLEAKRRAQKRIGEVENIDSLILLELDDGVCGICGKDVDSFNYHIDHIVPLCKGGVHTYYNTQVAHPECNLRKGGSLS